MDWAKSGSSMVVFVGNTKCRGPRGRWEGYIKMFLKEMGLEVVDWIHLVQGRS
jgi:hypothetical protein